MFENVGSAEVTYKGFSLPNTRLTPTPQRSHLRDCCSKISFMPVTQPIASRHSKIKRLSWGIGRAATLLKTLLQYYGKSLEALPGVAHPSFRDNCSTLNTKTAYKKIRHIQNILKTVQYKQTVTTTLLLHPMQLTYKTSCSH